MRWDDNWGQADCDLDLLLYQVTSWDAGREISVGFLEKTITPQDGSPGSIPRALIVGSAFRGYQLHKQTLIIFSR